MIKIKEGTIVGFSVDGRYARVMSSYPPPHHAICQDDPMIAISANKNGITFCSLERLPHIRLWYYEDLEKKMKDTIVWEGVK